MGSTLTLTRKEYTDALETIARTAGEMSYLDQFQVTFPDGLNTASVMEICRAIQDPEFESKVRITRICIAGKNVEVKCPNGDVEKFQLSSPNDGLEGFELFQKEPMALMALADTVYGYVLKKSLRPSKTLEAPETAETK